MSLNTGEIVDEKYRIVRLIGEGGMGAVYEGENVRIHRRVAIKVLHSGVAETAEAVQRFEREAQAAGRIGSEHIVEVLDLGNLLNGDRYMVMEFMDGDSLSSRIRSKGRLAPVEIYPIAVQMLDGLTAAHGAGIIHRDLKPDNIYLLKSRTGKVDFVKLLDFGISKFNQLSGDSGFSMTRTGAVMGTPYYMAPEQAKGSRAIDHRVDLYAAGVILYEAATGQVPFNAETFNELLFKIVLEDPQPLEEAVPGIDPGFVAIVKRAMARDPGERFQTAQEFRQALDQWAAGVSGGVPVLNAVGAAPMAAMPMAGTPVPGMALQSTPGVWAQTGGGPSAVLPQTPVRRSYGGLIAAIVVTFVMLAGGGGVAYSLLRGDDAAAEAERVAAAAKAAEEQKQREAELAELQKEREEIARARKEAEQARQEAEQAAAEAKTLRDGSERAEAEKAAAEKARQAAAAEDRARAASAKSTAKTTTTAAKTTTQTATPTAAPKPADPPPKKTTPDSVGGRKIRTDL
jgi:serine/threonine-protein kinase